METKTKVIIGVVIVVAAFGSGYFAKPSKIVTKTEIKEVIKEVKVVEQHNNVVTVTHTVTAPNGTTTTDTTTHDSTEINTNDHINTSIDTKKEVVVANDIGLTIQALTVAKFNDINDREYGILVKKRIIGNISGTVMATHKGTVGLAVGLDF
jgi:hypothetical protein